MAHEQTPTLADVLVEINGQSVPLKGALNGQSITSRISPYK